MTADAYEPNNSIAEVAQDPVGGTSPNFGLVTNTRVITDLNLDDSADWYRFETTETGTTHDYVRIDFLNSQGNLGLQLYDASGHQLADSKDPYSDFQKISLNGEAVGTYFILVYGDANPNYTLTVDPPGNSPDDLYEPNDTRFQVATETPGAIGSAYLGTVNSDHVITDLRLEDAADWFEFSTTAQGISANYVQVDFANSQGNLGLQLDDANGNQLADSKDPYSDSQKVSLNNLAAGTYFIRVYGDANPNYTLTISPPPVDESLSVDVFPATFSETAGPGAAVATVTRTGDTSNALLIHLASSDITQVKTPVTVTIAAGQASASVPIDAVDDLIVDGAHTVDVTAWASGYESGNANVSVTESVAPTPVVTNTNDTGSGSLRAAITAANASTGPITITFNIPGNGTQVIEPQNPLPVIKNSVVIDGNRSRPGVAGAKTALRA
ncbi:MAG TPA: pre-peptidase C-terminal domain-containing protein [Pirellulales bacterium]|nr:pre-peptidase C-terminal domain-containing protein [Pirellulales bacterium]